MVVLAVGMTVVLTTAGIDLSVGSMVALIACVMSKFDGSPQFWLTAVPIGFGVAISLGLFNGALIAYADVPPIIATLGTLFFYRGLCQVVMGDVENAPFGDVPFYSEFGEVIGASCIMALVAIVGGSYFYRSRWRRELLMLGGNNVAARYAGIPVNRRLLQVYGLMAILAFLAALSMTAHDRSVKASSYEGLELQVIVATVLGGTRVDGGHGSISGSVLGVFLVVVLSDGLRGLSNSMTDVIPFKISYLEYILMGGLLVLGVWLNDRSRTKTA